MRCTRRSGPARAPRVVVSDSIDPGALRSLLGAVDLERTLFNVVSKSGDTVETMARFLIVRDRLMREFGAVDYKDHVIVTTEAERGSLRQIVNDEGFQSTRRAAGRRRTILGASPRSACSRRPWRASTSRSCSRAPP